MTERKYRSATEELAHKQENPARVGDLKRCSTCGRAVNDFSRVLGWSRCPDTVHDIPVGEGGS